MPVATHSDVDLLIAELANLVVDHERLAVENLDEANSPRHRSQSLKKLSVLVPVYNEEWTVETLLRSVLNSPIEFDLEVIVVDDGSTDRGASIIASLAQEDDRIRLVRHPTNQGKGAAIRTAIQQMTGDIVIIQDADLEYSPAEYPRLIRPILEGHADVVFGSRFAGAERRVLLFWHSLGNKLLTLLCNILNDLNLTDMESCHKAIRSDVLRQLRLSAKTFTIEPELTTRLAQWGARIYEVPTSYRGRQLRDGKKTRAIDGIKAVCQLLWTRLVDTRFTMHTGMYVLRSVEKARKYNEWLVKQIAPFLGQRVVEAGAGIGNISQSLVDREHLLLVDHDPIYVAHLKDKFQTFRNVRVLQGVLTESRFEADWLEDKLDTVFCCNVLEHLGPHRETLQSFHRALVPGGHCIIIVPAEPKLYNGLDVSLGHHRRYRAAELRALMEDVGFFIEHTTQVCKLGSLAWFINGHLLRRRRITPRQMLAFDRCWPIMRWLDRLLPWRGMSLIMVGKKEERST